jgi:hypothetical protein
MAGLAFAVVAKIRSTLRSEVVIFVLVQKSSDLSSQLGRVQQLTHRSGSVKELPLEFRGYGVPLHDDRSAKTAKDMLLFGGEGAVDGFLFIRGLERFVEIVRQPLFVVGKRAEAVTRVFVFLHFDRVVRLFAQGAVCGCFRPIFLCDEHLNLRFPIGQRSALMPAAAVVIGAAPMQIHAGANRRSVRDQTWVLRLSRSRRALTGRMLLVRSFWLNVECRRDAREISIMAIASATK